ncbi:hypothetical protein [Streptomyces sp. NPDC095602]|uniref:hypothetical protein n=1 Tax=Streptomyces sp. NPDC095602 TaxID=3155819 RepID=UPI00331CC21E
MPGVAFARDTSGEHAHTRLHLSDTATPSWAAVDYDGRHADRFTATQAGPRVLWDEVAAAYGRGEGRGRPVAERYRTAVGADGTQTVSAAAGDGSGEVPVRTLPGGP